MSQARILWAAMTLAVCFLLWALVPGHPYSFFRLLRVVVCATGIYGAVAAFNQRRVGLIWLLGFVAAIYNPFIPIYLTRTIWWVLDLLTIGLLIFGYGSLKRIEVLGANKEAEQADLIPVEGSLVIRLKNSLNRIAESEIVFLLLLGACVLGYLYLRHGSEYFTGKSGGAYWDNIDYCKTHRDSQLKFYKELISCRKIIAAQAYCEDHLDENITLAGSEVDCEEFLGQAEDHSPWDVF